MAEPLAIDENALSLEFSAQLKGPRLPTFGALGLLISNYAKVETVLQMYARKTLGIDDSSARIVFSGLRVSDVTSRLNALLLTNSANPRERAEFGLLSEQLQKITKARHLLVHNGISFVGHESILVHKKFVSKRRDSFEKQEFLLNELISMADDCAYICVRILKLLEPEFASVPSLSEAGKSFVAEAFSPWRYA